MISHILNRSADQVTASPEPVPQLDPTPQPEPAPPVEYRTFSGHTFHPAPVAPLTVYAEGDMDCIDPGMQTKDTAGNRYLICEMRHVHGRLWRIVLLPLEPAHA